MYSTTAHARGPSSSSTLVLTEPQQARNKQQHPARKTVENLITAGLVDTDPGAASPVSHASRIETPKMAVGFIRASLKGSSSRQSLHSSKPLNWDQQSKRIATGPSQSTGDRRPLPEGNKDRGLSSESPGHPPRNDMNSGKGTKRRERTFIGCFCAACDEPLEHILRGERILQLSCGHVSHEACFYEYIKHFEIQNCPTCDKPLAFDTSRGGNIDFKNLNRLVRDAQSPELRDRTRDSVTTLAPWETETVRHPSVISHQPTTKQQRVSRDSLLPDQGSPNGHRHERSAASQASYGRHGRKLSGDTGKVERDSQSHQPGGRRHDYDVQSVETPLTSPRQSVRNPIPAPLVTVRSEFPTITKSRHHQSLTCLVTVEVVEGTWSPLPEDLPGSPPLSRPILEESLEPVRPRAVSQGPVDSVHEDSILEAAKDELFSRVENWHGLDYERFGKLVLHGVVRVGKDRHTWQELECYLFSEMLICVKERKVPNGSQGNRPDSPVAVAKPRWTLKGSILIKKHLKQVDTSPDGDLLTLSLSVDELPEFHLQFTESRQLEVWRKALFSINRPEPSGMTQQEFEQDWSGTEEDEYTSKQNKRVSSVPSSHGANSQGTAPTEYSNSRAGARDSRLGISSLHIPLDIVIVIPVTSSMQGLKINLLRDTLRFLVSSLGERDRIGLVTFGAGPGGVPVIGMTTKQWAGWSRLFDSIRPVGHKNVRADVVDGANVAMDLLMQRKSSNPVSHILLISDSSISDPDSVDFVVSRAEAAKIGIHSFGLGITHKPDTMVEMATRTKASYTYVKDWMMLRECLAGCLGALQSTCHQNVKVRLRLPNGSPAKFVKISGALHVTKRATGRDAEASLGDLRFGDKRDILIQLAIQPDNSPPDSVPTDPWEHMISGLEALGPMEEPDEGRSLSVEEMPILQADLVWGDILREGTVTQLPRPSLLAIAMLPEPAKKSAYAPPSTPPIPPHPSVVQRRMELLTSDMLTRALGLVARGQNDRAHHLLAETRSILKGLGKGGLPPLPTPPPTGALPPTPKIGGPIKTPVDSTFPKPPTARRTPSPGNHDSMIFPPSTGIDRTTMAALDSELEASLEWIRHPTVFGRDTRKSVLQAVGVISSQRGLTMRSPSETLWAQRIPGIRRLAQRSLEWRETSDDALLEESEPSSTIDTGSTPNYHGLEG